jgi:hypothetical protein
VRRALVVLWLCAFAGCAVATDAVRKVSGPRRPAFSEPGDGVTLAPTPDTFPYNADTQRDCNGCPPR